MKIEEVVKILERLKSTWAFTQESQFHSFEWAVKRGDWNCDIAKFAMDRREVLIDILSADFQPIDCVMELERINSIINAPKEEEEDLFSVSGVVACSDFESRFIEGGINSVARVLLEKKLLASSSDRVFNDVEFLHNQHQLKKNISEDLTAMLGMEVFTETELEKLPILEGADIPQFNPHPFRTNCEDL